MEHHVESLLSARLFLFPQHVDGRLFFVSNLSGHLSLYGMNYGGSVPEPLLPPNLALHNPDLLDGYSYCVFPRLKKILVMLDHDGDENYQPMLIPVGGGYPEPSFASYFAAYRVHLVECDKRRSIVYLVAERRDTSLYEVYRGDLKTGKIVKLHESPWPAYPVAYNRGHSQTLLLEGYTVGDNVLYLSKAGEQQVIYGKPLPERKEGESVPLNGLGAAQFTPSGKAAIVTSSIFQDTYGLGYIRFAKPGEISEVRVRGLVHKGQGELVGLSHAFDNHYVVTYNIDGCSWVYEGVFLEDALVVNCRRALVGRKPLDNGKVEHLDYDEDADLFTLAFSTAITPTQICTIEGKDRQKVRLHTAERILGIPHGQLAPGEDASFVTHDGLRISARLYMPAETLGFSGPRPIVYYVHGGPQGQERPDFAWFSMPLIQLLTLRGFAVFVPNVRGSTGYGLSYTKQVDRDWGGKDRLDHVYAMTKILSKDKRLDVRRAAVVGRSYGGYMTLMLAGRHPELWAAACDMFGPYDLLTFSDRIPPTWKPYYKIALGDPENSSDRQFLQERSPKTYLHNMTAPMLVIQGRNDPRVVAAESEDLVRELKAQGKKIELMIFENEGHDVLKYENRVACYQAIADFFVEHLRP